MRFIRGQLDLHRGVDLAAPVGTPVRPTLSGRVVFAGAMSGYGSVVFVDHDPYTRSVYAHLSEILVEQGQQVGKGTILGRTGQSGNVTGPHLHFEIRRWGRGVDPVPLLGGPPRHRMGGP